MKFSNTDFTAHICPSLAQAANVSYLEAYGDIECPHLPIAGCRTRFCSPTQQAFGQPRLLIPGSAAGNETRDAEIPRRL